MANIAQLKFPAGRFLNVAFWIQGSCTWTDGVDGHQVVLHPSSVLVLGEAERRAIRQAALARLRQLNLGVPLEVPDGWFWSNLVKVGLYEFMY